MSPHVKQAVERIPLIDEDGELLPDSHEKHFLFWKRKAEKIPSSEAKPPTTEGSLSAVNALDGLLNLEQALAEKKKTLESFQLNHALVRGVYEIALAYVWSAALCRALEPAKKEPIAPRMSLLRQDRKLMLAVAEAAMILKLIDEKLLKEIRRGRGDIDAISDVLALAIILPRDAPKVVESGVLVSKESIATAQARALELQGEIRPSSAPRAPAKIDADRAAVTLLRNQLWTLLVRAHDECELAAAMLVGVSQVREIVPGLSARKKKKKVVDDEAPAQDE